MTADAAGAVPGRDRELDPGASQRLHQRMLGLVPQVVGADPLGGARGDLVEDVGEAEVAVDAVEQLGVLHALLEDLVLGVHD